MTTATERREKARLRCERWRRSRGIMPRRKAQRPWLAMGVSRSTYYRRHKQAREREAAAINAAAKQAAFDRAEAFAVALRRDLDRCAALEHETMAIIAELAAFGASNFRLTALILRHEGEFNVAYPRGSQSRHDDSGPS